MMLKIQQMDALFKFEDAELVFCVINNNTPSLFSNYCNTQMIVNVKLNLRRHSVDRSKLHIAGYKITEV